EPGRVDRDKSLRGELTDDRLPAGLVKFVTLAEHGLVVVAVYPHLLGFPAHQHVHDMAGAEALPRAVDGGEHLDRRIGTVPGLGRIEAGIAITAIAGVILAEMHEQRLAAAGSRF